MGLSGGDAPAGQPQKAALPHSPAPPAHSFLASCFSQMDVFTSPPGQAYLGQSLSNSPAGESALEDGAGCFSSKSLLNPPSALGDPS